MMEPWKTRMRGDWIAMIDPDGKIWLEFHESDKGSDKEVVLKIVKAMNAHDELVAACAAVVKAYATHQVYDKSPLPMVESALAAAKEPTDAD